MSGTNLESQKEVGWGSLGCLHPKCNPASLSCAAASTSLPYWLDILTLSVLRFLFVRSILYPLSAIISTHPLSTQCHRISNPVSDVRGSVCPAWAIYKPREYHTQLRSAQMSEKPQGSAEAAKKSKGPAGGHDDSPVTSHAPGYTVKITFHDAEHLPIADLGSLSSDPYLTAHFKTDLPSRHKEDPPLLFRSRTVWRNTNPVWNQEWIIAHVPTSGFDLKLRLYDEDSTDKDDRLGNAHIEVRELNENWEGIQNRSYKIKKSAGSWRAYALRGLTLCIGKDKHMSGHLRISVEVLGLSPGNDGGRAYTIGPNNWCKNFSPLLGRIAGSKEPDKPQDEKRQALNGEKGTSNAATHLGGQHKSKEEQAWEKKSSQYNFQSNQMQLQGPVPPELYHRYVEFRPFMKSMFMGKGIRGFLLSKALHHQHTVVYNYNRQTQYGVFEEPTNDMTLKFLELAHWDEGGRIHTYVITLDGLLRFTETGKEFGIDLLSKHTMHSNVGVYIAFSGEFFIRRLKNKHKPAPDGVGASTMNTGSAEGNESHPPKQIAGGPPTEEPPKDPAYYELVIDNDSGTYRPNAKLLPLLREFLSKSLPGLKIVTLDCQKDEELMGKLKQEQRDRKKAEAGGQEVVYTQMSSGSSVSSSDDERLDELAAEREGDGQGEGHQ